MVHRLTDPADDAGKQPRILAAGVVLWRPSEGTGAGPEPTLELALVRRPKWDDWTFPKGKLKEGERHREAALREAFEETGMRVELGARLPTQHYLVKGRRKRVRYWSEVDRLEWLAASEARCRLTYDHDRDLVDYLLNKLIH
jgi:8-oxo-dGTP diphosphatase